MIILQIGKHHGFDCIDAPSNDSLPTVQMKHLNETPSNQKFYPGVFPKCEGLETNWKYDVHLDDKTFKLEIPDNEISTLHLSQGEQVKSEITTDDSQMIQGHNLMKSLMFFCFDQMELTQPTVS